MLYTAILWLNANIPNDPSIPITLDGAKSLVSNFEPASIYLRNVKFPVGTLTKVELSSDLNILEGTIDLNDIIAKKLSPYDIYPAINTTRDKGHLIIDHIVLQGIPPNMLTPPIKKITDQLPPP